MNRIAVSHYAIHAEIRRKHYVRRDQFERETALPQGVALITITLSSLGLWRAVMSVICRLRSALREVC